MFDRELSRGKDGKLQCVWDNCLFSAKHPTKVKLHVETVHLKLRKFKCELCEKDGVKSSSPPSFTTKASEKSSPVIDIILKRCASLITHFFRLFLCERNVLLIDGVGIAH